MSIQDFKIKNGDEILIKIKNGAAAEDDQSNLPQPPAPQGILPVHRADDYPARRLVQSGLFNFYDVGQVKNLDTGLFQDLAFNVSEGYNTIPEPIPFASWAAYYDLIFSIPLNEWKEKYRKIEYGEIEKYGIQITNDLITLDTPEWTANGLKYEFDGLRFFMRVFAHPILSEFDPSNYKITKENNFSADEAVFNAKRGGDLFFFPRIVRREVEESNNAGNNGRLWANYGIISREFWLNKRYTTIFEDTPMFQQDTYDQIDATEASGIDELLKSYPTTDYYKWTGSNQSTGSFVSKTSYPSVGGAGASRTYQINSRYKNSNYFAPFSNKLIAVIFQGGQIYYIWIKNIISYGINDLTWRPSI